MIKKMIARKTSERGQSFMELAVSIVFLLILLTVVIDLAWAFYTMIALRDAAQEAASFGSMCPNKDLIKERLRLSATTPISMEDIPDDATHIKIQFLNARNPTEEYANGIHGNLVKVTAQVDHDIIVPFAASFLGRTSYPLRVNVADTVMRDTCPN